MNDWISKLAKEEPLTPTEQQQLDAALKAQEQAGIPAVMQGLERHDAPEGIVAAFEKSLRRRGAFRFASGFAACAAASLAMFFALNGQEAPQPISEAPSSESLYDWHVEAAATSVLPSDSASLSAFSQVARSGEHQ